MLSLPFVLDGPGEVLCFLLPRRLCSFLPITPYHDHGQKTSHDGRAQKNEDDGYADGPDTGREEVVERVALVDEGLLFPVSRNGIPGGVAGLGSRGRRGWNLGRVAMME